ncbi:MAG: UspA domain protein [Candidatus Parvarchaeum acidiphilum ARMAN-4]|jgi:nucleotide-binding universal stress UspA family protein|uniref:UspA domain protein n=1 Tax=Candidatus Parvarchaeum acidiphilum ARMAN-4 TaxID=662760 RepID=D2EFF0_PARA4|nr:MAG: UspA domain protein [Candidatus Parvarchaeum acidiphilum ARMAN-4]
MIKSQKIAIGFDESKYSKKAVEYVINNFEKSSTVYLIYVEEMLGSLYLSNPSLFIDDSIIKKIREKTKKELIKEVEAIRKKGFKAEYEYIEGYPPDKLVNEAKRKNADIIVVGSRGMGKWKGSVLGSVSQKLTVIARTPLLIIK